MNDVMSRSEAAALLMDMSRRGGVSREEAKALQLGVRLLVKRHFDTIKNKIKREARKDEADIDGKQHGVCAQVPTQVLV